jgi:hypothetical protein
VAVGAINYLIGNGIFIIIWKLLSERTPYVVIAFLTLIVASLISFTAHHKITLQNSNRVLANKINFLKYAVFQIMALALGGVLVPSLATLTAFNLIFIQFGWSALVSIFSFLLISKNK